MTPRQIVNAWTTSTAKAQRKAHQLRLAEVLRPRAARRRHLPGPLFACYSCQRVASQRQPLQAHHHRVLARAGGVKGRASGRAQGTHLQSKTNENERLLE